MFILSDYSFGCLWWRAKTGHWKMQVNGLWVLVTTFAALCCFVVEVLGCPTSHVFFVVF